MLINRAHRCINKGNPSFAWIIKKNGFYIFFHQLPAPSAPEGGTLYLLPFENSKSCFWSKKYLVKKANLNVHQKTKSTYCVNNKIKAELGFESGKLSLTINVWYYPILFHRYFDGLLTRVLETPLWLIRVSNKVTFKILQSPYLCFYAMDI